jgi:hypothetical protein
MPSKMKTCEDYRTALTDAAAAAIQPSLELRSHLDACGSCRTVFTQESQLFAAIDIGLRATANSEVPPSFLPGVRTSLENASAPRRLWTPFLTFAAASTAIALTVFIAARPSHKVNDDQAKQVFSAPTHEGAKTPVRGEASAAPAVVANNGSHRTLPRRNSTPAHFASSSQLEVIVPPDEREAFARFISTQQKRGDVVIAVVTAAPANKDKPLSVEPLEIAELEVAALESQVSEVPDGTEEKQ